MFILSNQMAANSAGDSSASLRLQDLGSSGHFSGAASCYITVRAVFFFFFFFTELSPQQEFTPCSSQAFPGVTCHSTCIIPLSPGFIIISL